MAKKAETGDGRMDEDAPKAFFFPSAPDQLKEQGLGCALLLTLTGTRYVLATHPSRPQLPGHRTDACRRHETFFCFSVKPSLDLQPRLEGRSRSGV